MKYRRTILATIGMVALLVSFTSQAGADMMDEFPGLGLRINEHGQGPPTFVNPRGLLNAKNNFDFHYTHQQGSINMEIDIEVNADPFIYAVLTCVNMTGVEKSFTTTITLPISPQMLRGSKTSGSVSFTLLDINGGGALLSTVDATTPIYMSRIDGIDHQALMTPPQSWFTNTTRGEGPSEFGTPVPLDGPNVLNTIEIELNATLSAKDHAYIVARFDVTPEPATIALLTIGGVAVLLRRRRYRA